MAQRPLTLPPQRIRRDVEPAAPEDLDELAATPRPRTRADCLPGGEHEARPCPWVGCKWHLAIEVTRLGGLRIAYPDHDIPGAATCALDVADEGGASLIRVGDLLNLTRERIRQIERIALRRMDTTHMEDVSPDPWPAWPFDS